MDNYKLTQTGAEVQATLDLVPTLPGSIGEEAEARVAADQALQANIDAIDRKIPSDASDLNQLADKRFVDHEVTTAAANYVGTFLTVQDLEHQVENPTINDYGFVAGTDVAGNALLRMYAYGARGWTAMFTLNNNSFTTAEWASIRSGITTALVAKLSALPTNADLTTLLAGKQDVISDLATIRSNASAGAGAANDLPGVSNRVLFLENGLGKYDTIRSITLSQGKSGKYVNVDGGETSASGYGISNAIELNFGDILLVPSAQAVPAAVSVVARLVTRSYDKVINYTYTYRQANPELYDTATADYDQTLVYTAVYDTTGETPVLTGWTRDGQKMYPTLPATHQVTEQYYEPLVKQAVSAMPSTGYYVYLCPQAMTVVISGLTATVSGGVCQAVGLGIFKNIVSNFLSMPGQNTVAQAVAELYGLIDGLKACLDNLGDTKAECIDSHYLPKVCGGSLVIEGDGAPAVVPVFVGQRYHDTTGMKVYEAFAVTANVSDWVLLN